jgi:hypothetical protein
LSTSKAWDVLGTWDSATLRPGGTVWAAWASADASPVATAVVAVAATPPSAARTMVDTMVLREFLRGSRDKPSALKARTIDCYEAPFALVASPARTSLGRSQ